MYLYNARAQREHKWWLKQENQTDGQDGDSSIDETGEKTTVELDVGRLGGNRRQIRWMY